MDIVLLVLLLVGLVWGWIRGLFTQLVSLLGAVIGFLVACSLYGMLGDLLAPQIGASPTVGNIIAFFLIWICVPLLCTLAARVLGGILKKLKLGWVNNSLGAVFGVLKVALFLSVILSFIELIDKYKSEPIIGQDAKESSVLYYPIQKFAGKLLPSDFLQKVTSDPAENA